MVYRLEEDVSLLQEGGGRLSVWTLRAYSYKTKAEADTRALPHILFKGLIPVLFFRLKQGLQMIHKILMIPSHAA